jgi:GT2 family glycosyltransferase/thiol-disulfide isomerase/thioredoxin
MKKIKCLTKKFLQTTKEDGFALALRKTNKYILLKKKAKILNISENADCGAMNHNPLVSLIAVNYNGEKDLQIFLESILTQTYKNFELIIVDNASVDMSEDIIKKYQRNNKNIVYVKLDQNLGFAAGNNYAMPYCKGEFFGLINVDTRVDEDWLKELVDAISVDGTSGAVCSKTLFFERFQDVLISSSGIFKLDIESLLDSLQYKKYFTRIGRIRDGFIESENNKIIVSLPIQDRKIILELLDLVNNENIFVKIGKGVEKHYPAIDSSLIINLNFTQLDVINSSYIINNAGSISINNMPGDRGIGEYDVGQYDTKLYVDFFCGVSVLLRRSVLVDRKIFISEFFAYYEDSELSRYIRKMGYKILYAPRSIVYHQHSATSSEGSPLWQLFVARSQKIYNFISNTNELYNEINYLETYYKDNIKQSLHQTLQSFTKKLINRLEQNNDIIERLKPIAIYNSYWNTKGGGESHALSFANYFQKYETVYLVSETDFSMKELEEYYSIDLSNCRKIVQSKIDSLFTRRFDIFINSTFSSMLISQAKHSYYIVSFPHIDVSQAFLKSYKFLYNSDYTKKWAEEYWGNNLRSDIVYPIGSLDTNILKITNKEKFFLNVGRFFVGNHCKNQLDIAKAFKKFSKEHPNNEWKLVLIGSVDNNNSQSVAYLQKIENELKDLDYEIITNSSRDVLLSCYQKAYAYIHATGLGRDEKNSPDEFEHFGITPVEAMKFGSIPLVYSIGGPAELIKKIEVGYTFDSIETLSSEMNKISKRYETDNHSLRVENIQNRINTFIKNNDFETKMNKIIMERK